MKKAENGLYLLIFFFILILPVLFMNTKPDQKSELDNRALVDFPEITEENFKHKIELYLKDRLGFRERIITGYQLLNGIMTGEPEHPLYTYGTDGYVFYKMHSNIRFGNYHETFVNAVVKMKEYCEARNARFYFMLDPEKLSVYRQYLPLGVNYNDDWVDELLSRLEEAGVCCVDNKHMLTELSIYEQVFNRMYDAGHWNDLGCFYATNALWRTMHQDFPEVTEYDLEEFDITTVTEKYLPSSHFPIFEQNIPSFKLKESPEDISDLYRGIKRNKSYAFFRYFVNPRKEAQKYPKILVFQGSYYNRAPVFMAGRARECISVHDYQNVLNLDYYFNIFEPEAVVFEAAEYTLIDQYFDSTRMALLDFNPGLAGADGNVMKTVQELRSSLKEIPDADQRLNVIPGDGFDEVYLTREIPNARYVYLLTEDRIYDMQRTANGVYGTGIPHGAVDHGISVYYENYRGERFLLSAEVQTARTYDASGATGTTGVIYKKDNNRLTFRTALYNNRFNRMDLQLFDAESGEYVETMASFYRNGQYADSFIHTHPTGWYAVRLKANSNRQDEGTEWVTYLSEGERYFYSFSLNLFSEKKAVVENFEISGRCAFIWQLAELVETPEISSGVSTREDGSYILKTNEEGNNFNSIVLQAIRSDTGELSAPLSNTYQVGTFRGIYSHSGSDGLYTIFLRGNSNLMDESIQVTAELKTGLVYEWSYTVDFYSPKEIVLSEFSFRSLGKPETF